MSRTIKFRCWDQKDKKYLLPEKQGFVILPTSPSFGVTLPYENRSNPGNIDEDCIDWADADLIMGRYELEQYTGLTDKNGKEIYEGDIVQLLKGGTTYEVAWMDKDGGWWFCFSFNDNHYETLYHADFEVIGNIHENGELLGGEE